MTACRVRIRCAGSWAAGPTVGCLCHDGFRAPSLCPSRLWCSGGAPASGVWLWDVCGPPQSDFPAQSSVGSMWPSLKAGSGWLSPKIGSSSRLIPVLRPLPSMGASGLPVRGACLCTSPVAPVPLPSPPSESPVCTAMARASKTGWHD